MAKIKLSNVSADATPEQVKNTLYRLIEELNYHLINLDDNNIKQISANKVKAEG